MAEQKNQAPQSQAKFTVVVTRTGFWAGRQVGEGEKLEVTQAQFSKAWMQRYQAPAVAPKAENSQPPAGDQPDPNKPQAENSQPPSNQEKPGEKRVADGKLL